MYPSEEGALTDPARWWKLPRAVTGRKVILGLNPRVTWEGESSKEEVALERRRLPQ